MLSTGLLLKWDFLYAGTGKWITFGEFNEPVIYLKLLFCNLSVGKAELTLLQDVPSSCYYIYIDSGAGDFSRSHPIS
ncbi:hypothetical protein SLEP1_g49296 [Rubroshorea leprosula]|uniref:Uncharacterized protein n=1 Tax=Rubroshorea leprosula TaxID=152421 RepID=A0AAV5LXL8_9ROSI|nr:hypothetical protein SLEP1_g49296 [Rubroshorea leprosula]